MTVSIARRAFVQGAAASMVFAATPSWTSAARRLQEATPAAAAKDAWEDIASEMATVAPLYNLAATEIVADELAPIFGVNADELHAVGSSFKLYVLAAAGKQVRDGQLNWDDPVEIEDRYKSVPGGDLRYVDAGTTFTMRYLTERMIQKSDNTATDHLIALVGREAVEEMLAEAGHSEPARNIPLLTTREFALLKFASSLDDLERFLAADVTTRREILETEINTLDYDTLLASIDQTAPVEIERVEWFASPNDLTRILLKLKTMAESDFALQPLFEILALETQVPLDGERWPYAGFKGGSEMGVLHGSWLLRRADKRWFALSLGFNDPAAALDLESAIAMMVRAFDLIAATP